MNEHEFAPKSYKELKYPHNYAKAKKGQSSDMAKHTKVLPKTRETSAPESEGRHEKFQFGTNPMIMTEFERACVAKEVNERKRATEQYIAGIQGRDGGEFPYQQSASYCPDKF